MINRKEAILSHVSAHFTGCEAEGTETIFSKAPLDLTEENLNRQLLSFFLDYFKDPEFFQFQPIGEGLHDNFLYQTISSLFENDENFHESSIQITKWLLNHSKNHYIKSGEVMIFKVKNVLLEDEVLNAIGIFKIENKEPFLKISDKNEDEFLLEFELGTSLHKLDKACIVFQTDKEKGFKILNIDHVSRFKDAKYWRDDFLHIAPRMDEYLNTKQYIQLTKEFVNDRLSKQFDADKSEQAQTMQRSLDYFQKEEQFDQQEYASKVFKEDKVIQAFQDFKSDFEGYKQIELFDEFAISDSAVKNQSRVFKSIIKLDKNFHIYIHGNKNRIQKGIDEEGRKYYVLYYDEEH